MDSVQFGTIIQFLASRTGFEPPQSHRNQIKREIERICRNEGVSAEGYLQLVTTDADRCQQLMNIATINETYFFREERQFALLQNKILPELSAMRRGLRMWSVTCSSGEEAVSLGVLAAKFAAFHVYASDIHSEMLEACQSGCFSRKSLRNDGKSFHHLLQQYQLPDEESVPAGKICMQPELLRNISTHRFNLFLDQPDFLPDLMDVIFFRNTLLYMPMHRREEMVDKVVSRLRPGGYLFLSSGEVPFVTHDTLQCVEDTGVFYFQRKIAPPRIELGFEPELASKPGLASAELPSGSRCVREGGVREGGVREGGSHEPCEQTEILCCAALMNRGDYAAAEQQLLRVHSERGDSPDLFFQWAQLEKNRHNIAAARGWYEAALNFEPGFWPARFFLALLLMGAGDAESICMARWNFRRCLQDITDIPRYHPLLDGFSPDYYAQLCRKYVQKIGSSDCQEPGKGDSLGY